MREAAEEIAVVQPGHGNLRDTHLEEGGGSGEGPLLPLIRAETSSSEKVSTLHDTGGDEDFIRMLLMDDEETSRSRKIT